MPIRRLLPAAGTLAAVLVLAITVSASATRLRVSPQAIRAVWAGEGHMLTLSGEGTTVICPTTLEGSFHSTTFSKNTRSLIGYITAANVTDKTRCSGAGNFLWLDGIENSGATTLPWHVRYESFEGTLPMISGVRVQVIGMAFRLNVQIGEVMEALRCLYLTSAEEPAFFIFRLNTANGIVSSLRVSEAFTIKLNGMGLGCPERITMSGLTNTVTRLGETASVVFRLVA